MSAVLPAVATLLAWVLLGRALAAPPADASPPLLGPALETLGFTLVLLATAAAWQRLSAWRHRVLLAGLYLWALWFYLAVERLSPVTGILPYDEILLLVDESLWGATPSQWWAPQGWALEALSACYLGYHVYLHGALGWAVLDEGRAQRLAAPLFTTFGFGYLLYLLVPALGPRALALYDAPLEGGHLFDLCERFVAAGSSVFDAFPSMHTAITLTLLMHDAQHHGRRAALALLPVAGLLLSTIFLRYHYAIDVLVGAMVAGGSSLLARAHSRQMEQRAASPQHATAP